MVSRWHGVGLGTDGFGFEPKRGDVRRFVDGSLRERAGVRVQGTTGPAPTTPPELHGPRSSPASASTFRSSAPRAAVTSASSPSSPTRPPSGRFSRTSASPSNRREAGSREGLRRSRKTARFAATRRGLRGSPPHSHPARASSRGKSARHRRSNGCESAVDRPIP